MASGHNFSTHNSRSMEREIDCTAPRSNAPHACQAIGTQMLWRNPKWLRAELIWNNDCKTTREGVKPPLTDRTDEFSEIVGPGKMYLYCLTDGSHLDKAAWWQFSPLAEQRQSRPPGCASKVVGLSRVHKLRLSHSYLPWELIYFSQDRGEAV